LQIRIKTKKITLVVAEPFRSEENEENVICNKQWWPRACRNLERRSKCNLKRYSQELPTAAIKKTTYFTLQVWRGKIPFQLTEILVTFLATSTQEIRSCIEKSASRKGSILF